jgi:hypothetical protein
MATGDTRRAIQELRKAAADSDPQAAEVAGRALRTLNRRQTPISWRLKFPWVTPRAESVVQHNDSGAGVCGTLLGQIPG